MFKRCLLIVVLVAVIATASVFVAAHPTQKQVPVIGILVSPLQECYSPPPEIAKLNPNGCIESYYARWLEASAARIIPIPWNATQAHLNYLFPRLNGILFPGGGLDGTVRVDYFNTLSTIVDMTLEANEKNHDPMLLWGTCYGFQMMGAAIAKNLSVVTGGFTGMYPLMMALNFTAFQPTSQMFGDKTTPSDILQFLQTMPTTLNWHHAGITPEDWQSSSRLTSKLRPLSTNTEPSGLKRFISAYEGITANIFASQFHPERPPFEFTNDGIGHTFEDISVSRYLSQFVVQRAKMNSHSFETPADSEALILENHPLAYEGYGVETYYIIGDPTTKSGLKEFPRRELRGRRYPMH